ncbi:MAG: hypothetical protein ACTSU5_10665 [Promethearchaeota archaeon]
MIYSGTFTGVVQAGSSSGDSMGTPAPVGWFLELPLAAQVLLVVLALFLAFLAILGVVYLVKYLILGLGKTVVAVGKGVGKVAKAVLGVEGDGGESGEESDEGDRPSGTRTGGEASPGMDWPDLDSEARTYYCSLCGGELSRTLLARLNSGQEGFCEFCGARVTPE